MGYELRVAQIIQHLSVGGAEKLAVEIARARDEKGDKSHIILLSPTERIAYSIPEGVKLHTLDLVLDSQNKSLLQNAWPLFQTINSLQRLIWDQEIEVVQTHLPMGNFFGLFLAWKGTCRVYPTVHNTREFDYGDFGNPTRAFLRRLAYKQMFTYCSRMIAVSCPTGVSLKRELNLVSAWADQRMEIIPNGVVVPPQLNSDEKRLIRKSYNIPEDVVLIVGLGRLTEQKNFADLIGALSTLDVDPATWYCIIGGQGPQRGDLEKKVAELGLADRVILQGRVQNPNQLLGAADLFCLPSKWEGLPLALLEAMAAGLPIVANALDEVHDVVEDGVEALLVKKGDLKGLSGRLSALISDMNQRRGLGKAARKKVVDKFSMQRLNSNLTDVYRKV